MTKERLECVDAGSEYCPCYLAETNNCITCSHLQGKDFCDCNWRGVCIYQEYAWNGYKSKFNRTTTKAAIVKRINVTDNCTVLELKVTKTLARQLSEAGSYVFLRDINLPSYFDVPMSIMDTDVTNGCVYIAYQKLGSKTKKLDDTKDKLFLRGPYWNGVFGLRNLKKVKNSKCLIVARGIAQAPSVLVAKKLIRNNNEIVMIIDKGKVGKNFIDEYLEGLNLNIVEENVMQEKGILLIKNILKNENISLIYSGGSDVLHSKLINMIDDLSIEPYIVATNNGEICCGEGICGSCSTRLKDGTIVKTCKTQVDARKIIERRVCID
ncbi:sulfide/dihydroorotate dehydrogenase-like FAD/NAD-binding protein [Caldisalinibacter kiritimatiensis]|uniref:Dihydroorotate dehydrogenase electron transfer subunit n=1 Tax=Caldisalinibacter kiritimatiensis TaxID=1304284 RepID=R1CQZ2_9FIRM|nr:sulfide/dihydroorotate dehydrogenase-like FAD/NAD-binding protein [Caldisalinibacter kiritimatiensis]EOD01086.1 Dihydroorotate dehydrogenase electron transfer subunit [Caldisalinibacter kiritimatiensis]